MCGVFLDFPNSTHWSIFALNADGSTGAVVPQDNARLAEGRYVVLSSGESHLLKRYGTVSNYLNQSCRWRTYRCYSNDKRT